MEIDKTKLIIRRPTADEQRTAKIVTSSYSISSITIQSSVMKTLGWVDKIYRSKKTNIAYSNRKAVKHTRSQLVHIVRSTAKYTPHELNAIKNESSPKFVAEIENAKKWTDVKSTIPTIVTSGKFKTPKALYRVLKATIELHELFDKILDGMSCYKFSNDITMETLLPLLLNYLEKIETGSKSINTQGLLWKIIQETQQKLEEKLGKNFTPKMYANYVSDYRLNHINEDWHLNLKEFNGSWEELCDYLYSPTMIAEIRAKANVKVRAREKDRIRKGVENEHKTKFLKIIEKKKQVIGSDFCISSQEKNLDELKKKMEVCKNQYEEGRLALKHAKANQYEQTDELKEAVNSLRNKYNYAKKTYKEALTNLNVKKRAFDVIKEYERKLGAINEMIKESRTGEELSIIEREETIKAIRNQKEEEQIPYYTWRFVCNTLTPTLAKEIEKTLEEYLNKGSGINGEDGYINVTNFPMNNCYEFFVDYPKNSNLYKAFKKRGVELSNILIEGVANHLHSNFVNCKGETSVNTPMENFMKGDMMDWIEDN